MGLLGVAALLQKAPPAAVFEQAPYLRDLPEMVVRLLLLVNQLVLVTAMAAIGALLAHRVGLRSALAGHPNAQLDIRTAVIIGLAAASLLVIVDIGFAKQLGPDWVKLSAQIATEPWLPSLLIGVLYGGISEEVMMRWGLMSLIVWFLLRLHKIYRPYCVERWTAAFWIGILVSSIIFAIGHLPALSQSIELSPPIILRTIGLNLLAGIAYGWLFWRSCLESAMLAHAMTHVGLAIGRGVVQLL